MVTTTTADGVRFNATSTGTGDFVDASAVTGYRRGAGVLVDGAMYRYRAENATLSEYERGLGLWNNSTSTLTRLFIEYSSNAAAKTSFTSVPQVAVTPGPDDLRYVDTPDARLTLLAGSPVMTTSQSAKSLLMYSPNGGQALPLFDGVKFKQADFLGELVGSTTDTAKNPAAIGASKVNDWFGWESLATVTVTIASPGVFTLANHGFQLNHPIFLGTNGALPTGLTPNTVYYVKTVPTGSTFTLSATPGGAVINTTGTQSGTHSIYTVYLTHGPDWTNDTTPSAGTALIRVNGILLNAVSITNGPAAQRGTYLGTTATASDGLLYWLYPTAAAGGTAGFFGVWNNYCRVDVMGTASDTTDTWTLAFGNIRAANNSFGMRVTFVSGQAEDMFYGEYSCTTFNSASGQSAIGVMYDNTTAFTGLMGASLTASNGTWSGSYRTAAKGLHYYQAGEASQVSGSQTFYGDGAVPTYLQNGLVFEGRM